MNAKETGSLSGTSLEDVLRTLCRQLAWMPEAWVAKAAQAFYTRYNQTGQNAGTKPNLGNWKNLFIDLAAEYRGEIAIVIDAVDECREASDLVEWIRGIVKTTPRLHLLCSSRTNVVLDHLASDAALRDDLFLIDANREHNKHDLKDFIDRELELRRKPEYGYGTNQSFFCERQHVIA